MQNLYDMQDVVVYHIFGSTYLYNMLATWIAPPGVITSHTKRSILHDAPGITLTGDALLPFDKGSAV